MSKAFVNSEVSYSRKMRTSFKAKNTKLSEQAKGVVEIQIGILVRYVHSNYLKQADLIQTLF